MDRKALLIDLLIFDFDGTLADSIPSAVEAIQKMIKELDLPYKTSEEINRHVGYGEVHLVSGSIGSREPKLLKKAMEVYESIYLKEGIKKISLYPHVKELLQYFKKKTKLILSNKKDEFIKRILDDQGLTGYFAEVHGGDTAPCLKPDPCAINGIIEKHRVPKEKVMFVGDMTVDIETGKRANVRTCAVSYGFDGKDKLKKHDPDFLIDDLLELKGLIR